jgi:hypothetical protein
MLQAFFKGEIAKWRNVNTFFSDHLGFNLLLVSAHTVHTRAAFVGKWRVPNSLISCPASKSVRINYKRLAQLRAVRHVAYQAYEHLYRCF